MTCPCAKGILASAAIMLAVLVPMSAPVAAQDPQPLTLDEVLAGTRMHFPAIAAQLALIEAGRGEALAAEGAFDAEAIQSARGRMSGFWDGKIVETRVRKPLEAFGGEVYGGYRISDGRFPIYEDILFTNSLGEFKIGATLSLLRDREIDERRHGLKAARFGVEESEADLLAIRLAVQKAAMAAYYEWVAAGRSADIYRQLLAIAEDRDRAFARKIAEGQAAEILLLENRQNLIRREVLLAEADQRFADAGATLSLYLRDRSGRTFPPSPERLPAGLPDPEPTSSERLLADAEARLAARPELRAIDVRLAAAGNDLALARNALKPRLDVDFEISRDFGSGSITREGTDVILGATLKIPLQQRLGEGRTAKARAEMRHLMHRRQMMEERIKTELAMIGNALSTTERLVALADAEIGQALALERAENIRFSAGASDFFLLNVREERTADARVRAIEARLRHALAEADLFAAVLALEALGLGNDGTDAMP